MKAILVNHQFTPTWLLDSGLDYLIYDRSDSKEWLKDFPQERIIYTDNIGNADFDKLTWLVENYHDLPDVFLWGKTNLFKYISEEEWGQVKDCQTYMPLLTQGHKTYSDHLGVVCYYDEGMWHERNDSWYLNVHQAYRYNSYGDFAREFFLPIPAFLAYPPGGNYILTREVVHRYGKDFYDKMRALLPYCQLPGEAQILERTYHTLWK